MNIFIDDVSAGPAFPVVEATANTAQSADTTTYAITLPSGVNVGDLLLVVLSHDGAITVSISSGTGWTIEGQINNTSSTMGTAVIWKIADGSDALTVGFSGSERGIATTYRISGATDVTCSSLSNGAGGAIDPPSHTPGGGAKDYLWIVVCGTSSNLSPSAAPSNYTDLLTNIAGGTGSTHSSIASARRSLNASSEDPGSFTIASTPGTSHTIAVWPI